MNLYRSIKCAVEESPNMANAEIYTLLKEWFPEVNPRWLRNQVSHYRSQIKRRAKNKSNKNIDEHVAKT